MCENCEKKDYGKTLNLPKTDFPMRGNLPEREPDIQKEIFDNDLYEKILEKNKGHEKNIKIYCLYYSRNGNNCIRFRVLCRSAL